MVVCVDERNYEFHRYLNAERLITGIRVMTKQAIQPWFFNAIKNCAISVAICSLYCLFSRDVSLGCLWIHSVIAKCHA